MKHGTLKLLQIVVIPNLKRNLISLGMLDSIGCEYSGQGETLEIWKNSKVVLVGQKINGLYIVKDINVPGAALITEKTCSEGDLWHKRLAHISAKGLVELKNRVLYQVVYPKIWNYVNHVCWVKRRSTNIRRLGMWQKEFLTTSIQIYGDQHKPSHWVVQVFLNSYWWFFKKNVDLLPTNKRSIPIII